MSETRGLLPGRSADNNPPQADSTRLLIFAARLIGDGMDPREACRVALAEPLSDDPATVAALMDIVDLHVA